MAYSEALGARWGLWRGLQYRRLPSTPALFVEGTFVADHSLNHEWFQNGGQKHLSFDDLAGADAQHC